jgi:hypothetical protein
MPQKQITDFFLKSYSSTPPNNIYRFPLKALFGKLQPTTQPYLFSLKADIGNFPGTSFTAAKVAE